MLGFTDEKATGHIYSRNSIIICTTNAHGWYWYCNVPWCSFRKLEHYRTGRGIEAWLIAGSISSWKQPYNLYKHTYHTKISCDSIPEPNLVQTYHHYELKEYYSIEVDDSDIYISIYMWYINGKTRIGGMELVSLCCNRVFISGESDGRGRCKFVILTKFDIFIKQMPTFVLKAHQFHWMIGLIFLQLQCFVDHTE